MSRKCNKNCGNCLNIIDSIGLELKSLELVEDSLRKLTDKAIKDKSKVVPIDYIYLEIISTALYNSINDIKRIIY